MSIFICQSCKSLENTALCLYWFALCKNTPKLCSACDPKIKKWHGRFPQRPIDLKKEKVEGGYVVEK